MIERVSSFAHTGNPTTTPSAMLPATQVDDIVVVFVTNGGANSAPAALGGTSGQTWNAGANLGGPIFGNAMNGSMWWCRATKDLSGLTVTAPGMTGSSSLAGAVYRGALASGNPFRSYVAIPGAEEESSFVWGEFFVEEKPLNVEGEDHLILGVALDTAVEIGEYCYGYLGGYPFSKQVSAVSAGGAGTGAGIWDLSSEEYVGPESWYYVEAELNGISRPIMIPAVLIAEVASEPPVKVISPSITGTAQVGQTLSCSTGSWENGPTGYTYQWQHSVTGVGGWTNIGGATASTYKVQVAYVGEFLRCIVTASNGAGSTEASSAATAAVKAQAPSISSGSGTSLGSISALLEGTVNPNGNATDYWFEYGTTEAFGTKTLTKSAGAGSAGVEVSEELTGLAPGTKYFARLVGQNVGGTTNGSTFNFTTGGTRPKRRRKPSLALDVEVETPDGTYRLSSDSRKASKKPRGLTFNTQRGDGFATGGAQLSREILREYPDIGLLDTWRFVSRTEDVAYEGKLHSNPRTNDPEEQIDLALVGWMTYLKGRRVPFLGIDSRHSSFVEPSIQRKANLIGSAVRLANLSTGWQGASANQPGVIMDWTSVTTTATRSDRVEAWFFANGEDIGRVLYHLRNVVGSGNAGVWETRAYLATDDVASAFQGGVEHDGFTNANPYETLTANSGGYKYAILISSRHDGSSGVPLPDIQVWELPKVLGTHGLPVIGTWPEVGIELTALLRYMLSIYYPKVKLAGEINRFPVQQAAYQDAPIAGYEIVQQLNNLALWETNMWEDRTLYHEPADLTKIDWQFKTTDDGVKVNFQGDSIEEFANGISVTYTGFDGIQRTLWPSDYQELRDESEDNPANRHGEDLWTDCDVPWPVSEAEAIAFGRVYLAEFNRPKRPGSYTLSGGYIKDAAGHWQQGWKVKNGQTVGIMDILDDTPRLITATSWSDDGKDLTITVDAPDKFLDAVIARHEIARQGRGLA